MNDDLKFQILQLSSNHYLTTEIPDHWHDLTEQEQNQFIDDHLWQQERKLRP